MASTVIAGKPSNTVGEKDSTLVLRGSSVKVLWGNKFIDLIKNGKINAELDKILKTIDSINNAKKDGIYLVEDSVWIVIGDSKILLTGNTSTVYVSFVEELKASAEEKGNALKNIGFYYNTLEEALSDGISSGIIYVLGDNKLYTIIDGQFSEYFVLKPIQEEEKVEDVLLKMLYIEEYSLLVDGDEYLRCDNNQVTILKQLVTENGIYSLGASSTYGYKLYIEKGKSILEVDEVRERNPKYIDVNLPYALYTLHNNIVENIELSESNVICNLLEENKYLKGDYVYIYTYCLIENIYENGTLTFILSIPLDKEIEISINNKLIKIPKNVTSFSVSGIPENYDILYPKILKVLREYKILESEKQQIIIEVPNEEREMFLQNCTYLYNSRYPYIEILDNNFKLLDRSKEILNKETGKKEPDNTIHSNIGIIKENEIELLQISEEIETEDYIRPDVGMYSDNLIGLNPLLFNTIFKVAGKKDKVSEHYKYPKYDETIELPKDELIIDKRFNLVVPNMLWIKQILDMFIPIGTIIMWNGDSEPPPGWEICNGNNGTPNLVDRFIKGGDSSGYSDPEGVVLENGINKFKLEEKHLPYHTHPHTHTAYGGTYSDNFFENYATSGKGGEAASGEGVSIPSVNNMSSLKVISITIPDKETSEEIEKIKNWTNDPIIIEPKSYKLIFIIKVKNFVEI